VDQVHESIGPPTLVLVPERFTVCGWLYWVPTSGVPAEITLTVRALATRCCSQLHLVLQIRSRGRHEPLRQDVCPRRGVGISPDPVRALERVAEIEENNHGLPEHDDEPKYDVAGLGTLEALGQFDERHLRHHAAKRQQLEVPEGDRHD